MLADAPSCDGQVLAVDSIPPNGRSPAAVGFIIVHLEVAPAIVERRGLAGIA